MEPKQKPRQECIRKQLDQFALEIVTSEPFNWRVYSSKIMQKAGIVQMSVYKPLDEKAKDLYYFIIRKTKQVRNVFLDNNGTIVYPTYFHWHDKNIQNQYPRYRTLDEYKFNFENKSTYKLLDSYGSLENQELNFANQAAQLEYFCSLPTFKDQYEFIKKNKLEDKADYFVKNDQSIINLLKLVSKESKGEIKRLPVDDEIIDFPEEDRLTNDSNKVLNKKESVKSSTPKTMSKLQKNDVLEEQNKQNIFEPSTQEGDFLNSSKQDVAKISNQEDEVLLTRLLKSDLKDTSFLDDNQAKYRKIVYNFFDSQNKDKSIKFLEGLYQGKDPSKYKYGPFFNLAAGEFGLKTKGNIKSGTWYSKLQPYFEKIIPSSLQLDSETSKND